jgi:DNA-binding NarL/FixJ family response regulator
MMRRPTVLVADDHPRICEAIQQLLEPGFEVVGAVKDGRTLVKTAQDLKPDLVVTDVGLPVLNGLEAGRALKNSAPHVILIFLSMNPDPEIVREAFRIGASGYVLKNAMGEELLPAMYSAMQQPS